MGALSFSAEGSSSEWNMILHDRVCSTSSLYSVNLSMGSLASQSMVPSSTPKNTVCSGVGGLRWCPWYPNVITKLSVTLQVLFTCPCVMCAILHQKWLIQHVQVVNLWDIIIRYMMDSSGKLLKDLTSTTPALGWAFVISILALEADP